MTETRVLTEADETAIRHARLAGLLKPFPEEAIGKLPRKTKTGGVFYLDYVGHAATTKRLLTADPEWTWEPVAYDSRGLPALDDNGGLWIRLTVCDVTRLGYGDAQGKSGGDAVKELIGDAIRNAAMRFGNALDLWAKEDLSSLNGDGPVTPAPRKRAAKKPKEDWGTKVEAPTNSGEEGTRDAYGEGATSGPDSPEPTSSDGDSDGTTVIASPPSEGSTSTEGPGATSDTPVSEPAPPLDDDEPAPIAQWKVATTHGITGPKALKACQALFPDDPPRTQSDITKAQLAAVIEAVLKK